MENHIIVPMDETTGYKNTEEYISEQTQIAIECVEQELKETINMIEDLFDTKKDMNTKIHVIKHPEALYTDPLISEIMNQLSLINLSKKQAEKLEVKQSISWKKFKFTSFDGTKN